MNGALYSLLGNKDINIVAQNMGIENKIVEKSHVGVINHDRKDKSSNIFRSVKRRPGDNWSISWINLDPQSQTVKTIV